MSKDTSKIDKAFYQDALDEYLSIVNPSVGSAQSGLVEALGGRSAGLVGGGSGYPSPVSAIGNPVSRMAGGSTMRSLLQMLPAAAAVGGVGSAIGTGGDLITGDESRANAAMDLLGMGAGAYGMHRGRVGGTTNPARALQVLSGLLAGKMASDATQGIAGGMF